ncbi:MAG: hypothetical protein ACOVLB_07240 [Candidatus Nanopelagicus sp.]
MTYSKNGLIQATDYNNYVGTDPSSISNRLNTVAAVGNGRAGLGQPAVASVTANNAAFKVTAAQWNSLINGIAICAGHQGSTVTEISVNSVGDLIVAKVSGSPTPASTFAANLNTIYVNRNNCAAQGASSTTATAQSTTWQNSLTFVHTVIFESGDKARYFFNAGGQIALSFSHPTGTNVNSLWNTLATECGTVTLSAPDSGSATIAGTVFNGITKTGGSGTAATLATNTGYYALTSTNQEVFKQLAATGPAGYTSSFIGVNVKSNGTQGVNGDKGTILTITTLWDEIPNGGGTAVGTAAAGSTVNCTIKPPGTSYLTNTWGNIQVTGTVSGS